MDSEYLRYRSRKGRPSDDWEMRRKHEGCEWIAFLEGHNAELHYHLLWRISPELPKHKLLRIDSLYNPKRTIGITDVKLNPQETDIGEMAHVFWKKQCPSGDAKTMTIHSQEKLAEYVTKFTNHNNRAGDIVFSLALKNHP